MSHSDNLNTNLKKSMILLFVCLKQNLLAIFLSFSPTFIHKNEHKYDIYQNDHP
jgi:hypothetical protein